jgi:hypothetical protein
MADLPVFLADATMLLPAIISAGSAYAMSRASKPPKPSAPTRMPDMNSPEVLEARRRTIADRQAAGGRESTILSDDTYSNSLLGE